MHNKLENCKIAVNIMQGMLKERKKPNEVKETLGIYGFQPGEGLSRNKLSAVKYPRPSYQTLEEILQHST